MFQRLQLLLKIFFCLALAHAASAQVTYPKGDFINPLNIPLSLSGNFCELRNNHFHSGIDLRTNSEEGYLTVAVADGYVSRIKVSAFGYGNALYITHKNGYVSVYGHLLRFDSTIANYVKQKQYELESFEVDLFPKKNEISVTQGQIIALTGNTGGSEGPHLHFEIRDEKTEETINPFFFGFNVEDTIAPVISGIAVYALDKNATVNGCACTKYFDVKKIAKNKYSLLVNQIECSGNVGFGLITNDLENGSTNKNGTYSYQLTADSTLAFKYTCNRFAFDQTLYINAHIDYDKMKRSKERYQRCYLLPGNKLRQYESNKLRGGIFFNDTTRHTISISALDFNNNTSSIDIVCQGKKNSHEGNLKKLDKTFFWDKTNEYIKADFKAELPLNCLYEDVSFDYSKSPGTGNLLSDVHQLLDNTVPVHQAYTLSIKPKKTGKHHDKLLIVSLDKDGKPSSEGGTFDHGFVQTKTKTFGKFAVMVDTTKPTVKLINYDKQKLSFSNDKIMVKVSDNLSGIKSYRGTIDGQWVLMEFDNKEKTLCYTFDDKITKTLEEHELLVVVTDKKGNIKKLSVKFVY